MPGSEKHFAALAAVEDKTNATEALLRKKMAEQEVVDQALAKAQSELAAFRSTALAEHQQWGARREQMEAEFAAAAATIEASRSAALKEQAWHQELANRQTTATNELDGMSARLDTMKSEADDLQAVIDQRISQKENLLEEISRAGRKLDKLAATDDGFSGEVQSEESMEQVIMDLIRLVDAADTSAAYAGKKDGDTAKGQFFLLRQAIITTLKNLKVDEFAPVPGTPVDSNIRRQILVAKHLNGDAAPWIKSVVSPGFVTGKGRPNERFFRKAEVVISCEEPAPA